ncbi:ORF6N domain-containing protein [bacterium]|nr:ORF6N domain-containing protein [bacterium]
MKTDIDNFQVAQKQIKERILTIRGVKVIIDTELAELYGTTTKVLNQAVKRQIDRFPEDFAFRLTNDEKKQVVTNCDHLLQLKFSPVTPYAFTEHGAIMAANVLNSKQAVQMSVFVVRAFVKMREQLTLTKEMAKRLAEIEKTLIVHDSALVDLYKKIRPLLLPPKVSKKPTIGFRDKNKKTKYVTKK